jgi:carboxymethylenebutenolidase
MPTRNDAKSDRQRPSLRTLAAAGLVFGLAGWMTWPAGARAEQSPPAGIDAQSVTYPATGATIEAYVARPSTPAAKHPAVIVVHDDLGLNQTFRDLTHRLAQAGFVALAPHLPSRSSTPASDPVAGTPRQPNPVARLTPAQSLDDLKAAFAFLQKDAAVDPARISAIGVGWSDYLVWKLAEQTPTLSRVVVHYGVIPTDDDRLKTVRAQVLGHYAQQDYLASSRALKTKKLLGNRFTYYTYPTVPGFLGGGTGQLQPSTGGYVTSIRGSEPQAIAAAAKQAWTRTVEFLRARAPVTSAAAADSPFLK